MEYKILEYPCINIIYDDRHSEDYGRLLGEFIVQGICSYKFWDCIRLDDSVIKSINASHKMIVRDAKKRRLKECCIAEQDLTFSHLTSWEYFLKNKPEHFSVYVASTYLMPHTLNKLTGFHLYIIQEWFYDEFLSVPDDEHIDNAICDLNSNHKICYPFPALQRPGFSANSKVEVNYNQLLSKEDIYIG